MIYLGNAFSPNMMRSDKAHSVDFVPVSLDDIRAGVQSGFTSCIGHAQTAEILSSALGQDVPMNRISVSLNEADTLFVVLPVGGRLPEGATSVASDTLFHFWKICIN